jgi:hypothetical protein
MSCSTSQAYAIHPKYHPGIDLRVHGHIVKQGFTDGNRVAICHCRQHATFCNNKSTEDIKMSEAFSVGNDVLCHKVHQHFGSNDSGLAQVNEDLLVRKKNMGVWK